MPNANYQRGVRFERERLKHYKEVMKHDAIRASGSHGTWDIVSTDWERGLVHHIQCKVVSDLKTAERMLQKWLESPPYPPQKGCYQILEIKVLGSTEVHRAIR